MKKHLLLLALAFLVQPLIAQDWSLTGNAGTNPATNFLGTTDDVSLLFRRNNVQCGLLDRHSNTFFGNSAGLNTAPFPQLWHGLHNTGIGSAALLDNTTGTWNSALGSGALANCTSGARNSAFGADALNTITTSSDNCAFGFMALEVATSSGNTAVGSSALATNVGGGGGTAIGAYAMGKANNTSVAFTNQNVAVGYSALHGSLNPADNTGNRNVAIGYQSLGVNTSGSDNTALGTYALGMNTTGFYNTALGAWTLDENTTGDRNIGMGHLSLSENTTGSDNVALGSQALHGNKAGSRAVAIGTEAMSNANSTTTVFNNLNIAIGYQALRGSTSPSANTGNRNTAIGYQAFTDLTTGNENTVLGAQAMLVASTGSANTAVGNLALGSLTTGNNNTGLGRLANVSSGTLTNATALGYNCSVNASNKVRLGNSSITVVEGQVAYTTPSDARFKRDVEEDVLGLELILRLRPVSYSFDRSAFAKHVKEDVEGREAELAQASRVRTVGFLAQEVEEVVKETEFAAFDVVHVPEGPTDNYGLAYAQFVVPLVKSVQELHAENEALKEELAVMRAALEDRLARVEELQGATVAPGSLRVFPVPARDEVRITVDEQHIGKSATVDLLDASGKVLLTRSIAALSATTDLQLPPEWPSGSYTIVLHVVGVSPLSARLLIAR